jgi:hypothetical protein
MRRVLILTGALRTIKKTIFYLKRHVLFSGVDVFACVQNDTSESNESWNSWFAEQLGGVLRSIEWFSMDTHPQWIKNRELQLEHIPIPPNWKDYLRNSGSMIEYYQLQLAYMKMCYYEQVNGFRYDYVIRGRTDTIFAKPLDFHWLHWSNAEVAARVDLVRESLSRFKPNATDQDIVRYIMATLLSDDLLPNLENIRTEHAPCGDLPSLSDLGEYIRNGRYILTIRKNNLYILQRSFFYLIPTLGTMYGFLRDPNSDDYWFNAEGQFRSACYYSHLSVFDYDTEFDGSSLEYAHMWNESKYFDESYRVVNPYMLYCVVRK